MTETPESSFSLRLPITCECGDHAFAAVTQGYVTLVSPEDAYLLSEHRWCANVRANTVYVQRSSKEVGAAATCMLHKAVTKAPITDHKDGNGLDNRRTSLRSASYSQNAANRIRMTIASATGFRGVYRTRQKGVFEAAIVKNGRRTSLGRYPSAEDAARAYDKAARAAHGQFSRPNFEDVNE